MTNACQCVSITGKLEMKIQKCSNVISEAPLGKLCKSLIDETAVDIKMDVFRAYVHDFVHCMYKANQQEQEKEFMVRCRTIYLYLSFEILILTEEKL